MKILYLKHFEQSELLERLRRTTLLRKKSSEPPIFIFTHAEISLTEMSPTIPRPVQFYRLNEVLNRNKEIQKILKKKDIDIFHLNGFYTYKITDNGETYTLLPPIIEYQKQQNGETLPIIADGFHRIFMGIQQRRKNIQVVTVKNIQEQYAYPALPNPNGWKDVTMTEIPKDSYKKRLWTYPPETAYKFYHDFGSAFVNSSRPRSL